MKLKYLIVSVLAAISFSVSAQTYKGTIAAHRQNYLKEFLEDERSPLRQEDFSNLHFYDADSTFLVEAVVTLLQDQSPFRMPTFDGTSKEFVRYAVLDFQLKDKPYKLTIYRNVALAANTQYKDYLFLPFTDQTNNKETYGGGRYMDLKVGDIENNRVLIDFNKAYNPYCAYSTGYRCPIPPEENDLQTEIKAGEKLYTGEKKHK